MMDRNELLDLIPAYALDALDPDEKRQVEAFLASDAEAQKLLAEYQDITNHLVLATPARPAPTHLQEDLRKRLAANRPAQAAPTKVQQPPARRRVSIWLPLLAAAAVVAIIFGVITYLNSPEAIYNRIKGMSGYKTMVIPDPTGANPDGDMVASPDGTQAVIRMTQMPVLQSDHTFQLWLIDDGGPHSGGTFTPEAAGSTYYVVVPLNSKSVLDFKAYGVSVEPAGGSQQPSTTPIVVISTA